MAHGALIVWAPPKMKKKNFKLIRMKSFGIRAVKANIPPRADCGPIKMKNCRWRMRAAEKSPEYFSPASKEEKLGGKMAMFTASRHETVNNSFE